MLTFLSSLIAVVSIFLILLILVQRGKGGGLAGAFGGAGGQSAFGTKAGDMFTKVTAVTACIWIVLCAGTTWYMSHSNNDLIGDDLGGQAVVEEGEAGISAVIDETVADEAAGDVGDVGEGADGGAAAPAGDAPSNATTDSAASAADDPPAADPAGEEG